jgi:hypothetical protein
MQRNCFLPNMQRVFQKNKQAFANRFELLGQNTTVSRFSGFTSLLLWSKRY